MGKLKNELEQIAYCLASDKGSLVLLVILTLVLAHALFSMGISCIKEAKHPLAASPSLAATTPVPTKSLVEKPTIAVALPIKSLPTPIPASAPEPDPTTLTSTKQLSAAEMVKQTTEWKNLMRAWNRGEIGENDARERIAQMCASRSFGPSPAGFKKIAQRLSEFQIATECANELESEIGILRY